MENAQWRNGAIARVEKVKTLMMEASCKAGLEKNARSKRFKVYDYWRYPIAEFDTMEEVAEFALEYRNRAERYVERDDCYLYNESTGRYRRIA